MLTDTDGQDLTCNHPMCDLCGAKSCYPYTTPISRYGTVSACRFCMVRAVQTVYGLCCAWGGTIIDLRKPCYKFVKEK